MGLFGPLGPAGFRRRGRRRGLMVGAAIGASAANRNSQPEADAPEEVASQPDTDIEKLKQLAELKDQGILTQEEFDKEKAKILNG